MKRRFLLGLLPVLVSTAGARADLVIPDVAYPSLPAEGARAQDFVPKGWKIESEQKGDLDRDGKDDLVVLLRMDDARNIIRNDGLGRDPFDTNPRILTVALSKGGSKSYRLALANHTLIARPRDPELDDPLSETGGIAIKRRSLDVTLHLFSSAGSWAGGLTTYRFRHGKRGFELIGFDRGMTARDTGAVEDVSINYLTRKMKLTTGTIEGGLKVEWRKLPKKPLLTIEEIGDGLEFEPDQHQSAN